MYLHTYTILFTWIYIHTDICTGYHIHTIIVTVNIGIIYIIVFQLLLL